MFQRRKRSKSNKEHRNFSLHKKKRYSNKHMTSLRKRRKKAKNSVNHGQVWKRLNK